MKWVWAILSACGIALGEMNPATLPSFGRSSNQSMSKTKSPLNKLDKGEDNFRWFGVKVVPIWSLAYLLTKSNGAVRWSY